MIVSFGMTSAALLAGHKTVTRRDWKPEHAARFVRGLKLDAYNTNPRDVKHKPPPHKIATLVLTADAVRESSGSGEVGDWYAEGFDWMTEHELSLRDGLTPRECWKRWHLQPEPLYVVRFAVLEIVEPCYACGKGREEGHELEIAGHETIWQAGEDWSAHVYEPKLLHQALNAVGSS